VTPDEEFAEFAETASPQLRRTAFLLCGNWHTAEDLVQTTLTKVFVSWRKIRRRDAVRAYAARTLVNTYLADKRSKRNTELLTDRFPEHPVQPPALETRMVVLGVLATLPPRARAVVVLRYWEDLSVDQTAVVLGCSPGNVKSLANGKLGKWIKLNSGDPASIAIARDGKAAYVRQSSSRVIAVTPIDLTTLKAEKPISIRTKPGPTKGYYGQPLAIAISPDGKTAYVADGALSTVTPIDLANGTHGKPISLSGQVGSDAIAISSNGAAAYVANQPSSTVTPIELATSKPEKPIKIGSGWDSGFEAIITVP
jgi:RNA polymerase sigma-70 factor (sigma-E family)